MESRTILATKEIMYNIKITLTNDVSEKMRAIKAIKVMVNVTKNNELEKISKRFKYREEMRTTASVFRLIRNSQKSKEKRIKGVKSQYQAACQQVH